MTIKEYTKKIIADFIEGEGQEIPGARELAFDIGVSITGDVLEVNELSTNRIKFTLLVERS